MGKVNVIIFLLSAYITFSCWVYGSGTSSAEMPSMAVNGKALWHKHNCQNCHQVFGLGGYMGPDLTTVTGDKSRGKAYARAMLMNGGTRMPKFHFSEGEADELVAYLEYVNSESGMQKR